MRTALIALCALLMAPPGPVISAGPEPSSEDLSACQPVPRAPTQDAHRDAFLQRLDSVRCGEGAMRGALATPVSSEQRGAGLDQCSKDELQRLRSLNKAYRERFGFPFVVAVKGLSRHQIMDGVEARLSNDRDTEFARCLQEIGKIARFRLDALFA